MLLGVQLVAQALDALAADEDELGLARDLQLPEKLGPRVENVGWDRGTATAAELVPHRHGRRARLANEVPGLIASAPPEIARCGLGGPHARSPKPGGRRRRTTIPPIRRLGHELRLSRSSGRVQPVAPSGSCWTTTAGVLARRRRRAEGGAGVGDRLRPARPAGATRPGPSPARPRMRCMRPSR